MYEDPFGWFDSSDDASSIRIVTSNKYLKVASPEDEDWYLERQFKAYKARSEKKKVQFKLTRKKFDSLCRQPCHYCKLFRYRNIKFNKKRSIRIGFGGLDRIIVDGNYELKNIVPCCKPCNIARGGRPYKVFIRWTNDITRAGIRSLRLK